MGGLEILDHLGCESIRFAPASLPEILEAAAELFIYGLVIAIDLGLGVGLARVAFFLLNLDKRHGA